MDAEERESVGRLAFRFGIVLGGKPPPPLIEGFGDVAPGSVLPRRLTLKPACMILNSFQYFARK